MVGGGAAGSGQWTIPGGKSKYVMEDSPKQYIAEKLDAG